MKQNKHSTKKYNTKEILGIPNSEEQRNDNDCEKLTRIYNKEILDKEKNKKEFSVEQVEY